MIKHNDKILVVDVEETCWESALPPEGQQPEIIQIGWAWLDLTTTVVGDIGQTLVKPQRSKISEYCTRLTGITPKMAKSGKPFPQACKYILHHLGCRSRPWAAWGNDKKTIDDQCREMDCESPFPDAYLNLQLLTAVLTGPLIKPRPGLDEMMVRHLITARMPPHRADNDAANAAEVLGKFIAYLT